MNDDLGGCVSRLNIKYSKVARQICPQGVDADCSLAVTVNNHNIVGGESDQTADVARLRGTNPSRSDCGNVGDIQVATGVRPTIHSPSSCRRRARQPGEQWASL